MPLKDYENVVPLGKLSYISRVIETKILSNNNLSLNRISISDDE